ncbi:unnamed protein product, partial [Pocillopora meandrina]
FILPVHILLSLMAFLGNFLVLVALHKVSSLHPPSKLLQRCLATTDLLVSISISFSAVNILLSITAILGNSLILVALHKESCLHPPSKLLYRCLAATDLLVGLVTQPHCAVYWMSVVYEHWSLCRYARDAMEITGYTLCGVSLLTMTAISVDRLLAMLLGLRYKEIVTFRRTYIILAIVWVACLISGLFSHLNFRITFWGTLVSISSCLVISITSYTKIFRALNHHQAQIQDFAQQPPSQPNSVSFSAVNILLSITATLGNSLILVALHKESSLHPPSKLFYRCLATTDLLIGLVTQPLYATYWMSLVHEHWSLCQYSNDATGVTCYVLCLVSLLTLTAISVDRLLALLLRLRYKEIVTLRRTYIILAIFWVVSLFAGLFLLLNNRITLWCSFIITLCCLVTSFASYTKIFCALGHHQVQIQDHAQQQP